MKSILLLICLLTLSFGGDCWPAKWNEKKELKGVTFPYGISRDSVLLKMNLRDSVCGIGLKNLPSGADQYIAVSEDCDSLYVGMFRIKGEVYELLYRFSKKYDGNDYRFEKFDFAPYRLSKNIRAFGLRFWANGALAGGGYGYQNLVLFAPIDDSLQVVMSTVMEGGAMIAGDWLEDGSRIHYEEEVAAILMIGEADTTGYNCLIKKMTIGVTLDSDELCKSDTFYWNPNFEYDANGSHSYGMYESSSEMHMGCCYYRLEF